MCTLIRLQNNIYSGRSRVWTRNIVFYFILEHTDAQLQMDTETTVFQIRKSSFQNFSRTLKDITSRCKSLDRERFKVWNSPPLDPIKGYNGAIV